MGRHIKSKHEGVKYPCNQCDYKATGKRHLPQHVKSQHEGVKYPCNQCNYQGSYHALKFHIKSKHNNLENMQALKYVL